MNHFGPTRKCTVYPHARGADSTAKQAGKKAFGLSPRTWGGPRPSCNAASMGRSIPTHVGRTFTGRRNSFASVVYPHARGADKADFDIKTGGGGLSPRTWGGHLRYEFFYPLRRSIPTHVGRTMMVPPTFWSPVVYPHARGADPLHQFGDGCKDGLSPRTWGGLILVSQSTAPVRSIPTHVGRTLRFYWNLAW